MNKFQNVLIVDANKNDQKLVALLFKRTLTGLSGTYLTIRYASSFFEAQNFLSNEQFTIVTLDGEFPGFINPRLGKDLIPFIKESQSQDPVVMMISNEKLDIKEGLKHGAHFAFHKQNIKGNIKLNENFELVPALVAVESI